ncbi:MAG: hypothetical protein JWO98_4514 [Frankiales bacterium]|nr:hypothetical protein [Frankiales bacterium]
MLTAHVWHGRDGYALHIAETPLWALVAEKIAEAVCVSLGHPLCRGIRPIGFRFGQWLLNPAGRRQRPLWSTALTDDDVRERFPESLLSLEDGE